MKGTGGPEEQSQPNLAHYALKSKRSICLGEELGKKTSLFKKKKSACGKHCLCRQVC